MRQPRTTGMTSLYDKILGSALVAITREGEWVHDALHFAERARNASSTDELRRRPGINEALLSFRREKTRMFLTSGGVFCPLAVDEPYTPDDFNEFWANADNATAIREALVHALPSLKDDILVVGDGDRVMFVRRSA